MTVTTVVLIARLVLSALPQDRDWKLEEFKVPGAKTVVFEMPDSWVIDQKAKRRNARTLEVHIIGSQFDLLLTLHAFHEKDLHRIEPDQLRRDVVAWADGQRDQILESDPSIIEISGTSMRGYYFMATDGSPFVIGPPDFPFMIWGLAATGTTRAEFSFLANDLRGPDALAFRRILASMRERRIGE